MSARLLEHCSPNESAFDAEVLELGRRLGKKKGLRGVSHAFQERATSSLVADPHLREALFRVVDVAPAPRVAPQSASSSPILLARRRRGSDGSGNGGWPYRWDLLGEASVSLDEARLYANRCDEAPTTLAAAASRLPERSLLERDSAGVIPRVNLPVKVTALTLLLRPHAPDRGRADLAARLRQLLRRARDVGAHLHIDADADLDEVLPAILGSAFGFAGQKCPAASRLQAPA